MRPLGEFGHQLARRTKTFTDRHPWVGPTIFMLSVLYLFAQLVVAWAWHPPYSFARNVISDLGNTSCGQYHGSYVCSPRHGLMNGAFIFLGAVMIVGSALLAQEFAVPTASRRRSTTTGFALVALGGFGAILVGAFPENTVSVLHVSGAGLAIGSSNLGVLALGWTLPLPVAMRTYMRVSGIVSIAALVLFAAHLDLGAGAGTMERIAAYPETVWLLAFGVYVSRSRPVARRSTA
jgi:hypothetical membrane protein